MRAGSVPARVIDGRRPEHLVNRTRAPHDVVVVLRAPHDVRGLDAPDDGPAPARGFNTPRCTECPRVAAGQRNAAVNEVVAPDDVAAPGDAFVFDDVAWLRRAVLRRF